MNPCLKCESHRPSNIKSNTSYLKACEKWSNCDVCGSNFENKRKILKKHMTYFMKLRDKYYNIIDAIDDRADIAMQKQPYLKAYKEQTNCEVCVYDFEIKEICRNT